MPFYRNYSMPPRQPFALPIASHPPAAPCGPGQRLARGEFVSRGGVFEGPAMSYGDQRCGYWSDYVGAVPLFHDASHRRGMHPPGAALRVVPSYPPETPAGFQPRRINLGYPGWQDYEHADAGLGSADTERQVTMAQTINRARPIWTGPGGAQPTWPAGMTPRGGVLDGNALATGRQLHAAYYGGESPRTLQPAAQVNVLPNPLRATAVPQAGWGVDGPEEQRRYYGAQEAVRPTALRPAGVQQSQAVRAVARGGGCPKPVAASIFGGQVPGGQIVARSVFDTPVQTVPGSVPAVSTLQPRTRAVSVDRQCAALGRCGPDGLG